MTGDSTVGGRIGVHREGGVVTATVDTPGRKNALSTAMLLELGELVREVERNDADRVLVITGAGGDFCSGADLTQPMIGPVHPLEHMRRVSAVALDLHNLGKPTIAKVRGVAIGAGCNLALCCDLVAADDTCRFSEAFVRLGMSVDFGGSWLLPRLIGLHRAKELALLGGIVDAARAERMGLVNHVVPAAELDGLVDGWAAELAAGAPVALSLTKQLLNTAFETTMGHALENEGRAQVVNLATADSVEAVTAYRERRPPRFSGDSLTSGHHS